MKRYKITAQYNVAGYDIDIEEQPDGEWVRYEDVVRNDEEGFVYFGDKKISKIKEMELSGQSSIEGDRTIEGGEKLLLFG